MKSWIRLRELFILPHFLSSSHEFPRFRLRQPISSTLWNQTFLDPTQPALHTSPGTLCYPKVSITLGNITNLISISLQILARSS